MKNNRFSQKRNPHHLMPSQHSQHSQQQGSPTSSIPPQKHVNVIHNIVYHTTGPPPPMMDPAQHYSQPGYYYAPPYMTDAMLGKMAPMSSSPPLIQHYTSDPAFLEYPMGQYSHGLSQIDDVSQPSMMMSSPLDEYDEDLDEEYMYDQPPTPVIKNRSSGELRYVHGHHLGHHQQQQPPPQPPPPPPQQQQQSELLPPHQHHRVHHPHQFPQLQSYHLQHRGQPRHANTPTYQTYHQKYQYPAVPPEVPLDHQYRIPYPSNHQHHRQRQQTTLASASASSPPPPPPPQQHHRYRIPQYQQQQRPLYYKSPNVVMSPDETMPYAPGEYDDEYDSPQGEYQQDDSMVMEDIFDGDPIFDEFDYNDEDTYFNQQIPNADGYGELVDMEMTTSTPHTQYPTNFRTNNKRTTTTITKPPAIQTSQSRPVPKPNKKVQQPITKMLKKANSSNQLRPKSAKSTPASTPSSIPAPTVRQQKQMATKAKNTYIDDRRLPFDDSAQTMGSNNNKKVAKPAKKPSSSSTAGPPKNTASADNYRKYSFVFEACSNIRKKNPPSSTASTPAGLQSAGAMITPATETTTPATNFTPTTGIEHKKSNSNSSSNSFTVSPVILDNDGFNTFNMVSPR